MSKKLLVCLISGILVFGISKLSFAMMCSSGRHSKHQQTAQTESSEHKHMQSEAAFATAEETVNIGNKICPVSGEKIDEKMKATYEYEGKIYNFCCSMCIDEFKKDPEKYIKKVEEELKAGTKEESKSESPQHEDMPEGHHSH
jgi:YHS domain-containing protein